MSKDSWPDLDRSAVGIVVPGYGVASGFGPEAPYDGGSLPLQMPYFEAAGLDFAGFHVGTVNVDLAPLEFIPVAPAVTVEDVAWTDAIPPETFSFFHCRLATDADARAGFIYRPHPETKVEHVQAPTVIEIIAPWIVGAQAGNRVFVSWSGRQADTR